MKEPEQKGGQSEPQNVSRGKSSSRASRRVPAELSAAIPNVTLKAGFVDDTAM
jgi:hypothetical protein